MPVSIFVSYSHEDEELVKKLVQLMKLGNEEIFYDGHIEPGDDWEKRLWSALTEAATLIVFWCRHSKDSRWVERE